MISQVGHQLLRRRLSDTITDDTTGLLKFIQTMYLYWADEVNFIDRSLDNIIPTMNPKSQTLATAMRFLPSVGCANGVIGSMQTFPRPFYEESLELARYINSTGKMTFCETPYLRFRGVSHENKFRILWKVHKGEMPNFTNDEMDGLKKEIDAIIKTCGDNVIHMIYGVTHRDPFSNSADVVSDIRMSSCKVPKRDINIWKKLKQERIDEQNRIDGEWSI